jgi:hypothetical protein
LLRQLLLHRLPNIYVYDWIGTGLAVSSAEIDFLIVIDCDWEGIERKKRKEAVTEWIVGRNNDGITM